MIGSPVAPFENTPIFGLTQSIYESSACTQSIDESSYSASPCNALELKMSFDLTPLSKQGKRFKLREKKTKEEKEPRPPVVHHIGRIKHLPSDASLIAKEIDVLKYISIREEIVVSLKLCYQDLLLRIDSRSKNIPYATLTAAITDIRNASMNVCVAIKQWRDYVSDTERRLNLPITYSVFMYCGSNYLVKMQQDLLFLDSDTNMHAQVFISNPHVGNLLALWISCRVEGNPLIIPPVHVKSAHLLELERNQLGNETQTTHQKKERYSMILIGLRQGKSAEAIFSNENQPKLLSIPPLSARDQLRAPSESFFPQTARCFGPSAWYKDQIKTFENSAIEEKYELPHQSLVTLDETSREFVKSLSEYITKEQERVDKHALQFKTELDRINNAYDPIARIVESGGQNEITLQCLSSVDPTVKVSLRKRQEEANPSMKPEQVKKCLIEDSNSYFESIESKRIETLDKTKKERSHVNILKFKNFKKISSKRAGNEREWQVAKMKELNIMIQLLRKRRHRMEGRLQPYEEKQLHECEMQYEVLHSGYMPDKFESELHRQKQKINERVKYRNAEAAKDQGATKIQSSFRSKIQQRLYSSSLYELELFESSRNKEPLLEDINAMRIQAVLRGHLGRKIAQLREADLLMSKLEMISPREMTRKNNDIAPIEVALNLFNKAKAAAKVSSTKSKTARNENKQDTETKCAMKLQALGRGMLTRFLYKKELLNQKRGEIESFKESRKKYELLYSNLPIDIDFTS